LFAPKIRPAAISSHWVLSARDYRDLNDISSFDKLVTVGIFEHMGEAGCHSTFNMSGNCCGQVEFSLTTARPVTTSPRSTGSTFISRYVFPHGELARRCVTAKKVRFEMRDVESLREHYMLTLGPSGRAV